MKTPFKLLCSLLVATLSARASDPELAGPKATLAALATIELEVHGRLGVAALDTGSGRSIEYRAAERFPMCSTFKFLLAAAILQKSDLAPLSRKISYEKSDLLEWAPITTKRLPEGKMTVEDLCAAAIQYSDNTAANLLLRDLGGPAELTKYIRTLGDRVTRLDRTEPSLNTALPGDERDTTTPSAMVSDLKLLLVGKGLADGPRSQLEAWLAGNTTGATRIRAGLPPAWRVGDKTGTGSNGTVNDIAIVRPPKGAPILIAIYLTESPADTDQASHAIAQATTLIVQALGDGRSPSKN